MLSGPPYPELDEGVELIRIPGLQLYDSIPVEWGQAASRVRTLADADELWCRVMGRFMEMRSFGKRVLSMIRSRKEETSWDVIHDNQSIAPWLIAAQDLMPTVSTIHHPVVIDRDIQVAQAKSALDAMATRRWYSFVNMQRAVAPRLRAVVCPTPSALRDCVTHLGVREHRSSVAANGVDQEVFYATDDHRAPLRIVTCASAMHAMKGLNVLVRAMALVVGRDVDVTLDVVGGQPSGEIRRLIRDYGLSGRIAFHSPPEASGVAALYRRATIGIVPSLYEGFGLPALEMMACGTPVIASRAGGLTDVCEGAAVLVPPGDATALSVSIRDLIGSQSLRTKLQKAGFQRMESYTWAQTARDYLTEYDRVIMSWLEQRGHTSSTA